MTNKFEWLHNGAVMVTALNADDTATLSRVRLSSDDVRNLSNEYRERCEHKGMLQAFVTSYGISEYD